MLQRIIQNWKSSLSGISIGILAVIKLVFDKNLNPDIMIGVMGLIGLILGLFAKD